MDPNACLERVQCALSNGDSEELLEARRDLREWLYKGGFEPAWRDYPEASSVVIGIGYPVKGSRNLVKPELN